jgi:hypothetical protein
MEELCMFQAKETACSKRRLGMLTRPKEASVTESLRN